MTIEELAARVIAMLNAQARYFSNRSSENLIASKRLEKSLRSECEKIAGVQQEFGL